MKRRLPPLRRTPRSNLVLLRCTVSIGLSLLTVASCSPARRSPGRGSSADVPHLTHGAAIGEVTATSAVLWSRCDREATLDAEVGPDAAPSWRKFSIAVNADHDFTGRLAIDGLAPGSRYAYRVGCTITGSDTPPSETVAGSFETAPDASAAPPVRFIWSGDLGGQNACRDRHEGYSIFERIRAERPGFFVALGDMIYADSPCRAIGLFGNEQIPGPLVPAVRLPEFWERWKYNRADPAFVRLLSETPMFAIWDDHEIVDDAGPHHDTLAIMPDQHLLPTALHAFMDYQPYLPPAEDPSRLYRSVRWGRHLELFILDQRQYRDANARADSVEQPKTMLGPQQREWLMRSLRQSRATWKIIVSSVPISVPTGSWAHGRDGWANYDQQTGFEQELLALLRFIQDEGIGNVFWITTDAHFGAVFRYAPPPAVQASPFYEVITGPLNAGLFPKDEFDTTLGTERLFLYGPAPGQTIASYEEAKRWFNFGMIDVAADGRMTLRIVNGLGATVYEQEIVPAPLEGGAPAPPGVR